MLLTWLVGCAGGGAFADGSHSGSDGGDATTDDDADAEDGDAESPFRVCRLAECVSEVDGSDLGVCGECLAPPSPPDGGADGGGGDDGTAPPEAAVDDPLLASEASVQAGFGGDCSGINLPPLPAGCYPIHDTGLVPMRWLECHRQAWLTNPTCYVLDPLVPNGINGAMQAQIVGNCSGKPTLQAKLECVGEACDVLLDGTEDEAGNYVCRHHAACVDDVLDAMGIPHVNEGSFTHAFTEVPMDTDGDGVDDAIMVMDAYNDIYYICDT
ncbi:MAG: hypothetical protein U0168_12070 [Nannocystaceae bacterium]